MQYGVWYGLASWFAVLKLLGVEPLASVSWLFVVPLLVWPSLPRILVGLFGRHADQPPPPKR